MPEPKSDKKQAKKFDQTVKTDRFLRFFAVFVKNFAKKFGGKEKMSTFAIPNEKNGSPNAEIAQLVEHNLAKVGVASSSLVFRSKTKEVSRNADLLFEKISPDGVPLYVSRPCAQGRLFCFTPT